MLGAILFLLSAFAQTNYNRFTFLGTGLCAADGARFARLQKEVATWTESQCVELCRRFTTCRGVEWQPLSLSSGDTNYCSLLHYTGDSIALSWTAKPGTANTPANGIMADNLTKCYAKDVATEYSRFSFVGDGACGTSTNRFTTYTFPGLSWNWAEDRCVDECRAHVDCVGINWEGVTKKCHLLVNQGVTLLVSAHFTHTEGTATAPASNVFLTDEPTICYMKDEMPEYIDMRFIGDGYCVYGNQRYTRYEMNVARYNWDENLCLTQCHLHEGCRGAEWSADTSICSLLVFPGETLPLNHNNYQITTDTAPQEPNRANTATMLGLTNSATCFWKEVSEYTRFSFVGVGNCLGGNDQRFTRFEANLSRYSYTEEYCIDYCRRYTDCIAVEWTEKTMTCGLLTNPNPTMYVNPNSWTRTNDVALSPAAKSSLVYSTTDPTDLTGEVAVCWNKDPATDYSRFTFVGDGQCVHYGNRFTRQEYDIRRYAWDENRCINQCRNYVDCVGVEWAPGAIKQCSILSEAGTTITVNRHWGAPVIDAAVTPATGVLVVDEPTVCYMKNAHAEYPRFRFIGDGVCAYGTELYTRYERNVARYHWTELDCVRYCLTQSSCRGAQWVPETGICGMMVFVGETMALNTNNWIKVDGTATREPVRSFLAEPDSPNSATCYWKNTVADYSRFTHMGDGICMGAGGSTFNHVERTDFARYDLKENDCIEQCRIKPNCVGIEWVAESSASSTRICRLLANPGETILVNTNNWHASPAGLAVAPGYGAIAATVDDFTSGTVASCFMKDAPMVYTSDGFRFIGDGACANARAQRFTSSVANLARYAFTEQDCIDQCKSRNTCVGIEWEDQTKNCGLLADRGVTIALNRNNWIRTEHPGTSPATYTQSVFEPTTCYFKDHSLNFNANLGGLTQQQAQNSGCAVGQALGQGCNGAHVTGTQMQGGCTGPTCGRRRVEDVHDWIVTYRIDVSSAVGAVALRESIARDAARVQENIRSNIQTNLGVDVGVGEIDIALSNPLDTMAAVEAAEGSSTPADLSALWLSLTALASVAFGVLAMWAWSRVNQPAASSAKKPVVETQLETIVVSPSTNVRGVSAEFA